MLRFLSYAGLGIREVRIMVLEGIFHYGAYSSVDGS